MTDLLKTYGDIYLQLYSLSCWHNTKKKIKFKWLLSMVSRYAFNIFKDYKEILDFKLILSSKEGSKL